MRKLITIITLLLSMMIGNVGAQSSGESIFSNAVLSCDGRVTFDITDPDAIVEGDYVGVTVTNGAAYMGSIEVTMIVGQKSYQVKFDTTCWFNGLNTRANLYYNDELIAYTEDERCLGEPTPSPSPKPTANSFQVTGYARVCTDDSFKMTWTGTNLSKLTYFFVDQDDEYSTPYMYITDPSVGSIHISVNLANWGWISVRPQFTNGNQGEWKSYWVEPCGTPLTPAPTQVPVGNSFALTSAQRACADQTFSATWSGSNVQTVEFALSNTSDEWISGWLAADPSAGSFTSPVDHHGYDKVVVRATFVDGTTSQKDADVGTCDTPAEPEHPSMPSQPADSSGSANTVTSLPKTGAGDTQRGLRQLAVITGAVALAGVIATTMRKQHAR